MLTIHFIRPDGKIECVEAREGRSVMDAAVRAEVPGIDADCGGRCSCATCHVAVDEAFAARLPPADDRENEMLGFVVAERRPGSRLSCRIVMTAALDGLVVRLPGAQ